MSSSQTHDRSKNTATAMAHKSSHHHYGSPVTRTRVKQQPNRSNVNAAEEDYVFLSLWDLPEVLLYHIVTFVAGPTHRASVICHQIAPLSKASYQTLLIEEKKNDKSGDDEVDHKDATRITRTPNVPKSCAITKSQSRSSSALWDALLKEDYGVVMAEEEDYDDNRASNPQNKRQTQQRRRVCSRLKRTRLQRVRDAHALVMDNTELCYFYLCEMAHSASAKMTKSKFVSLLTEYGPHLRINNRTRTGGTFLVEVCRAQHVRENVVLKCVQVLVEQYGASLHLSTRETKQSYMTPLCVASARGMPTVVQYLLNQGGSGTSATTHPTTKSTARFRLFKHRRKTIRCTDATPLEFAKTIRSAEIQEGATERELKDLDKCIRLLQTAIENG